MTLSAKSHTETNTDYSVEWKECIVHTFVELYIFRDSKCATRLMHVHNGCVLCIYSDIRNSVYAPDVFFVESKVAHIVTKSRKLQQQEQHCECM